MELGLYDSTFTILYKSTRIVFIRVGMEDFNILWDIGTINTNYDITFMMTAHLEHESELVPSTT